MCIRDSVYTDTDAAGGSIAFKGIEIRGAIAVEIDIIKNQDAMDTLGAIGVTNAATVKADVSHGILNDFAPAGDVVRIALPDVTVGSAVIVASHTLNNKALTASGATRSTNNLYFGVDSIKMGGSSKSFGSFAMTDIKMQGTTALIWAH